MKFTLKYLIAISMIIADGSAHSTMSKKNGPPIKFEYAETPIITSLIDTSLNRIIDPCGALLPLMQQMKDLKHSESGVVPILHIGDSHIQAGFLTDNLRTMLQQEFGNAGRGLVAPLKLIGTNGSRDYSITSPNNWIAYKCTDRDNNEPLGVSAMAISTADSQPIFTINSNDIFCTVRALHHAKAPLLKASADLDMEIHCDIEDTPTSTKITLNRGVNTATISAQCAGEYNTPLFYGFSLENGSSGILYHASGINGATFEHYNNNPAICTQSNDLRADLIIVSLGTNDASGKTINQSSFYTSAKKFIETIRNANPQAAIILTTPFESFRRTRIKGRSTLVANSNIEKVAQELTTLATNLKIACWDLYHISGGKGANAKWKKSNLLQSDRVHMNKEGYNLQSQMLYDAIIKYYNKTIQ